MFITLSRSNSLVAYITLIVVLASPGCKSRSPSVASPISRKPAMAPGGGPTHFTSAGWKSDYSSLTRSVRASMVNDLQAKFLRNGMSKPEIIQLLGEPDQRRGKSDIADS